MSDPTKAEFGSPTLPDRFWSKVSHGECWTWTGGASDDGYGSFYHDGRSQRAHRVAYTELVGPIPEGLQIDHLCRNRRCVNPGHMEPVTQRENIIRGESLSAANARKTHCKRGHEFTPENTYLPPDGYRYCRACQAIYVARRRERRRAAREAAQ